MPVDANQRDPERGARLSQARTAAGLTQRQAAEKVGTSHTSLSAWENGAPISEAKLDALTELYRESKAWLRYGEGTSTHFARAITERTDLVSEQRVFYQDAFTPNPTLRKRLPPKPYARVYEHIAKLEAAGVSPDQIEEAERTMIDGAFNKLNKRDPRDRTDAEMIMDIDSAWRWIREVLEREGVSGLE